MVPFATSHIIGGENKTTNKKTMRLDENENKTEQKTNGIVMQLRVVRLQ